MGRADAQVSGFRQGPAGRHRSRQCAVSAGSRVSCSPPPLCLLELKAESFILFDVLVTEWLACVFFFLLVVPASRASEFLRDYDGSVIQMRMAYSAVAHFLVQWTDCKLAGALGLLKIMLYKVSP